MKFTSLLAGNGIPTDIGIPKDAFLCVANFGVDGGDPAAWAAMDDFRMQRKLLPFADGRTVCFNTEDAPCYEPSPDATREVNESRFTALACLLKTCRRVRPGLRIDLNYAPVMFDGDRWWKTPVIDPAAAVLKMQEMDGQFRRLVLPCVDSLSSQQYFHRMSYPEHIAYDLFGGDKNGHGLRIGWVDFLLSFHHAFMSYGKPLRVLFNLFYEHGSVDALKGKPIAVDEFQTLLTFIRPLGFEAVMLWGYGPSTAPPAWDQKHPLWQAVLAEAKKP